MSALPCRRPHVRVEPEQVARVVSVLEFDEAIKIAAVIAVHFQLRLKFADIGVETIREFFDCLPVAANVSNVRFRIGSCVPRHNDGWRINRVAIRKCRRVFRNPIDRTTGLSVKERSRPVRVCFESVDNSADLGVVNFADKSRLQVITSMPRI